MIGAILGLAMSAASTAYGAVQNKKNADKQQENLNSEKAANEAYRSRYYYEDPLARAGARRMMQRQMENVQRLNRSAQGTKAVVGGTEESIAATNQANASALADTAGQIVASADARKDAVDANYMKQRQMTAYQQQSLDAQRAANTAAAVQQAGQAAGQFATSMDGALDEKYDAWKAKRAERKAGGIRKPDTLTDVPSPKGPASTPDTALPQKPQTPYGGEIYGEQMEMPFAPGAQGIGNKKKYQ